MSRIWEWELTEEKYLKEQSAGPHQVHTRFSPNQCGMRRKKTGIKQ